MSLFVFAKLILHDLSTAFDKLNLYEKAALALRGQPERKQVTI